MIRLIIIMISLFPHIENYFDSTTIYVTMQIIMIISLHDNNVYFIDVGLGQLFSASET